MIVVSVLSGGRDVDPVHVPAGDGGGLCRQGGRGGREGQRGREASDLVCRQPEQPPRHLAGQAVCYNLHKEVERTSKKFVEDFTRISKHAYSITIVFLRSSVSWHSSASWSTISIKSDQYYVSFLTEDILGQLYRHG